MKLSKSSTRGDDSEDEYSGTSSRSNENLLDGAGCLSLLNTLTTPSEKLLSTLEDFQHELLEDVLTTAPPS